MEELMELSLPKYFSLFSNYKVLKIMITYLIVVSSKSTALAITSIISCSFKTTLRNVRLPFGSVTSLANKTCELLNNDMVTAGILSLF